MQQVHSLIGGAPGVEIREMAGCLCVGSLWRVGLVLAQYFISSPHISAIELSCAICPSPHMSGGPLRTHDCGKVPTMSTQELIGSC